jgi:ketosteroid isomerase-like protein
MKSTDPKSAVLSFLENMRARDFAAAYELIADDAIVWNAIIGAMTKSQFMDLSAKTIEQCKNGWNTTILGITTEGERVAVEAKGFMELSNDNTYNNEYHLLFKIRPDGKIFALYEYMDTAKAIRVFGQL